MKAVVHDHYGLADVLAVRDLPAPVPADDEVLIRVRAASVNAWDWDLLRGVPLANRVGAWTRPRHPILGADVAGVVEVVGPRVRDFVVGDRVYGDLSGGRWGGFAEYAVAPPVALARMPDALDFTQAAAVPQAGLLALQALRGSLRPGHRVLFNGAGGGVGTLGIQIARALGAAHITAVDKGPKLDSVRDLGADVVIDFTTTDFTEGGARFDLILDPVGRPPVTRVMRALARGGTYTLIGGASTVMAQGLLLDPWYRLRHRQRVRFLLYRPSGADLASITPLLEDGSVIPVIDRSFPLERVPDALTYFGRGDVIGKVVIRSAA